MSIESEVTKLNTNLTNSYTACQSKGATMPANQNFDNLATCIGSIQTGGGGSTLITKTITANGTYNASSDNADGYSQVTVNVSSSGSIGITREVSANGVYQMPATIFTFNLPSNATDLGAYAMYYAFYNCTGLTSVNLSNLTTISGQSAMQFGFRYCTGLTSVNFSSLTTVSGGNAMSNAFYSCTRLTSVLFTNLETIGTNTSSANNGQFSNCFNNCTNLTSITFPNLEKIYCTGGTNTSLGTFANNNKVQKMYFPKLDTITYGSGASSSNQNACKNVFYGCSALTELHFGAANQSAIQASPGYSTAWGRGAGNVTIYFDL